MFDFKRVIIVTGHYGSGKTNLAINLALHLKNQGGSVTLADLDVVNPYFRSADFKRLCEDNGIDMLASDYANSNLDIPSVSGALDAKICATSADNAYLIIDVGGDDAGAHALGRYASAIKEKPYTMLYVVNKYRYLTQEPSDCLELLAEIEAASRLTATHIANCSNLGAETTAETIIKSQDYAENVAKLSGKPIMLTAASDSLTRELSSIRDLFPTQILVQAPWN